MKILVVEDEHKIAHAIKKGLEQERYNVEVVYDGDAGLAAILGDTYDVVILDRMLPGSSDGIEICKKAREAGVHTPILFLTAKDHVRDRVEGLDAGADDYLVKPFAFEELLARVRALLRRPQDSFDAILEVEDVCLDPVNFVVKRGSQPIQLSRREFMLLEYLMRNQDRVLSKESIMNHVWDFDSDILPNTVEVYMGYLRNKVEKPFEGPQLIHTVRGFGYRFGVHAT